MLVEQFVEIGKEVEIHVETLRSKKVFNITLHIIECLKCLLVQDRLSLVELVLQGC